MLLFDVNVLVYAHREDAPNHLSLSRLVGRYSEFQYCFRHWDIFVDLCAIAGVKGNLAPDAYLAALAIESGSEWITTDRDYSRFPGLSWRHPFA
jgi:predicted nucleic acid-binding protein